MKSARPDDVFVLAAAERDLRTAIASLHAHARTSADDGLARDLLDTKALDKARARKEREAQKLDAARSALAETQAALQERLQRRESDIRTKAKTALKTA